VDAAKRNCNPHDKDDGVQSQPFVGDKAYDLKILTPKDINKLLFWYFLHEQKNLRFKKINVPTTKRFLKPFFGWDWHLYVAGEAPVEVSEFITSAHNFTRTNY
jgi:hypothetical protein